MRLYAEAEPDPAPVPRLRCGVIDGRSWAEVLVDRPAFVTKGVHFARKEVRDERP